MFLAILNEPVRMREGDKVRKLTKMEAIQRGVIANAAQGDLKAIDFVIGKAEELGYFDRPPVNHELRLVFVDPKDSKPSDDDDKGGSGD